MHRKFDKSLGRGQTTAIEVEEYQSYSDIRSDTVLDRKKLTHYFSLFAPNKTNTADNHQNDNAMTSPHKL